MNVAHAEVRGGTNRSDKKEAALYCRKVAELVRQRCDGDEPELAVLNVY
jgi:hypothetical protein